MHEGASLPATRPPARWTLFSAAQRGL